MENVFVRLQLYSIIEFLLTLVDVEIILSEFLRNILEFFHSKITSEFLIAWEKNWFKDILLIEKSQEDGKMCECCKKGEKRCLSPRDTGFCISGYFCISLTVFNSK